MVKCNMNFPASLHVSCTGGKYNKRCNFTCTRGYNLQGVTNATCKKGQWMDKLPRCKGGHKYL